MGLVKREAKPNELAENENNHKIIRPATENDLDRLNFNRQKELESKSECLRFIEKHQLKMKLVDVEYQFDCNKITFYFTAEKRVDFRELVKDLAATFRTRIELRQIGVRDEAKRIGGFGICGNEQCCSAFLNDFQTISTQMARTQNLALNPQKISGNCGRLLCCLLYEQKFYEKSQPEYPQVGSHCKFGKEEGVIDKCNIFYEEISIKIGDGDRRIVSLSEYKRAVKRGQFKLLEKPSYNDKANNNNKE
ncbi:MAG: stage 0 sporulation protein [candidate division Zixibacteria bacterium]|nr:stage 0 sporulation protein [candidate division Zixibacteria bacterium]